MSNRIFVGNLSWNVSQDKLNELFSQAGKVTSAFIPMDREANHPRGFGFVEMASDEEAEKAIKMFNGYELEGRTLACDSAKPREQK